MFRPGFLTPMVLLTTAVAGQDEYGNDVIVGLEQPVKALAVWPRVSDESTQGRNTVIVGMTAVLPYGTAVRATDRVRWDGRVWEIEGEPGVWGPSPFTGNTAGVEIAMTRVEG